MAKQTKTTRKTLEERQGLVADLRKLIEEMDEAAREAESCETPEDFDANLDSLLSSAKQLIDETNEVRS